MAVIARADGINAAGATEVSVSGRRRRQDHLHGDRSPSLWPIGFRLRRETYVAVVKATDVGQANDAAVLGWLDSARLGGIFLERKVRRRAVVVAEVAAQTTTEVFLVEDDHVVEQLAADGADHARGEGVLPGRAWCCEDLGDAHTLNPSSELAPVDAVAIAKEIARRRVIGERLDDLLSGPGGSRRVRDVKMDDPPTMMLEDHEHVENSESRGRHDEEVNRDEVGEVILKECAPGLRGRLWATGHQPGHCAL